MRCSFSTCRPCVCSADGISRKIRREKEREGERERNRTHFLCVCLTFFFQTNRTWQMRTAVVETLRPWLCVMMARCCPVVRNFTVFLPRRSGWKSYNECVYIYPVARVVCTDDLISLLTRLRNSCYVLLLLNSEIQNDVTCPLYECVMIRCTWGVLYVLYIFVLWFNSGSDSGDYTRMKINKKKQNFLPEGDRAASVFIMKHVSF